MTGNQFQKFLGIPFMRSRIPAQDALSIFVPAGKENDLALREMLDAQGCSRWIPVEGGHKVLILHESGEFDTRIFSLEKGVWDHEHCEGCHVRIEAMTLCWVSESDPFIILCQKCYSGLVRQTSNDKS